MRALGRKPEMHEVAKKARKRVLIANRFILTASVHRGIQSKMSVKDMVYCIAGTLKVLHKTGKFPLV